MNSDNFETLDFTIVFDGGAIGNPGLGYGSFRIFNDRIEIAHVTMEYGDRVTNNFAEYRTLIDALSYLKTMLGERTAEATVKVLGDSLLVISQLNGVWKVKNAGLRPLYEEARLMIREFAGIELQWHERSNSVLLLGH